MGVPTILVIEDNFADIALLRLALDRLSIDYNLEILSDGQAALTYIDDRRAGRREPAPCVILLDLYLPKYNGIQVLNAIRVDPVLCDVNVIVFTSAARPGERSEIEILGALLRTKPSDLKGFYDLAEELVQLCTSSSRGTVVASVR